tara:strand:+ start:2231 stop:2860 length:630 start_codon:yes stop_codon:yes gene_type:complete
MATNMKVTTATSIRVLEGITTPAGEPTYPRTQSTQEVQEALDFFTEDDSSTEEGSELDFAAPNPTDTLSNLNDILIVRTVSVVENVKTIRSTDMGSDTVGREKGIDGPTEQGAQTRIVSHDTYENKEYDDVLSLLYFNYGMPEEGVSNAFSSIFKSIRDEFTPPFTTKSFVYDFKFCENQNGSIVTGSVARRTPTRRVPTRTTSGGGGY